MKYILILFMFLFISCKQPHQDVEPYGLYEPPLDTTFVDTAKVVEPKTTYSYIVFVTLEPDFDGQVKNQYITEIDSSTIEFSEDVKYRILDEAENNLRDVELNDVETSQGKSVKIITRDLLIFDNYKDASISRQEKLNY